MPKRIPPRDAIEVYVSDKGYVCIKQLGALEESIVALEPSQVPTVIRWLQGSLPEATELFVGVEDDDQDE
jgi:hypothetical protein